MEATTTYRKGQVIYAGDFRFQVTRVTQTGLVMASAVNRATGAKCGPMSYGSAEDFTAYLAKQGVR